MFFNHTSQRCFLRNKVIVLFRITSRCIHSLQNQTTHTHTLRHYYIVCHIRYSHSPIQEKAGSLKILQCWARQNRMTKASDPEQKAQPNLHTGGTSCRQPVNDVEACLLVFGVELQLDKVNCLYFKEQATLILTTAPNSKNY